LLLQLALQAITLLDGAYCLVSPILLIFLRLIFCVSLLFSEYARAQVRLFHEKDLTVKRSRTSSPLIARVPLLLDLQPLFDMTQAILGQTEGIAERLCQTVTMMTQEYAVLELVMVPLTVVLPSPHPILPIIYDGYRHGLLHLLPDPQQPHLSALSIPQGHLLASCLAQQCYLLEQSALMHHMHRQITPKTPEPLTKTENLLLWHLMHGETEAEIAAQWGIAVKTVNKHGEHLHEKLGVHSHRDAVLVAHQHHLLPLLDPPPKKAASSRKHAPIKRR
jgi:DNA-binding CsgD family transcriptional regulator